MNFVKIDPHISPQVSGAPKLQDVLHSAFCHVTMKHIPKSARKKVCTDFIVRLKIVERNLTDHFADTNPFVLFIHIRGARFDGWFAMFSDVRSRRNMLLLFHSLFRHRFRTQLDVSAYVPKLLIVNGI